MIMELRHHEINAAKRQEYGEYFEKLAAIEERVGGLPPMRFFTRMVWSGGFTFTWMREWESLAQMEAAYLKLRSDSEFRALWEWSVGHDLFTEMRGELYSAFTMETELGETL